MHKPVYKSRLLIAQLIRQSKVTFVGLLMGAADIVPGISGGTVAFISGIYQELIYSLSRFNLQALGYLYRRRFRQAYNYTNLSFLLRLVLGIVISLITMAHLLNYVLIHYPTLAWSLFAGLVTASAWIIAKHINDWDIKKVLCLALGFILAWQASSALNIGIEPSLISFFLGGTIAISAMLLPGLSGSFLLVLMGLYQPVLMSIKDFNLSVLFAFACGCLAGLMIFPKIINWLLVHYRHFTLAFLLGLTLGALRKLWPWQLILSDVSEQSEGQTIGINNIPVNVSPQVFERLTEQSAQILLVSILFCIGLVSILALSFFAEKLYKRRSSQD